MGDFADVAIILADWFDDGGTLDVVPSDIIVGLRTLARVQRQEKLKCRNEVVRRASIFVQDLEIGVKAIEEDEAIEEDTGLKTIEEDEMIALSGTHSASLVTGYAPRGFDSRPSHQLRLSDVSGH